MSSRQASPPGEESVPMTSSLEVSEIQEELVRLNLRIKAANEEFDRCAEEQHMERLNAEVRRRLALFRDRLGRLGELAAGQRSREAADMLLRDVDSHREQMEACQRQFRQANLDCILRLQNRDRGALLEPQEEDGVRQRKPGDLGKTSLVKESGVVTDNLASISRKLAATVERSALTVDELASSSSAVRDTQDEFKNMGAVLGQSRKLINKYGRRETTDKVLILFAFAFFFACVFYVLRKRVLGPLDPFSLAWNAVTTLTNTLVNTVMTIFVNSWTPPEEEATVGEGEAAKAG